MSTVVQEHETGEVHLTYGKYIFGFLFSVILTVFMYILARDNTLSTTARELWLALLAIVQFWVQMMLFLHVNEEKGPKTKLLFASLMLAIVLILVGGSLWVMHSLNSRMMMTPTQMNQYLKDQDGGI